MPPNRLATLEAMSAKTPQNPMVWYGLAMEYRSLGQLPKALEAFARLLQVDARFVPGWFQLGLTLDEAGQRDKAVEALREGVRVAQAKGDGHAASEMEAQLDLWAR